MKRWPASLFLIASAVGCGGDDDDAAEVKTPLAMEKVPAAVLKAAKEAGPGLSFFAAYEGKHDGKDSIELKGRSKTGQIKEIEVSPDGHVLGIE